MQQFHNLLEREVTRKEFLATVGFGIVAVLGFGSVLDFLGKPNPLKEVRRGIATSAYGGIKRTLS